MLESQSPPEIIFDQTERITARLRDLVRSYPKGLALVKEFLQNADDAGAKDLRLIYDRRHHPDAFPNHPGMKVALGPALLFFNDQYFTESDFNGIQQIGEGSKGFDAARTGRFGQGFNTCYSVSDHPSLLTGNRIAWFDPHHYALEPGKNARAWQLSDAAAWWPEWILTFAPAVPSYRYARSYSEETLHIPQDATEPVYYWHPDDGAFPGTVFRLPVRSAEHAPHSEILPEAFTDKDFDAILNEIRRVGPALLIFLRSVTSLEIHEISADGKDTICYWIHTNNAEHVEEKRKKLRDVVNGKPEQLLEDWLKSTDPLPVVQFDQVFVVCDGEDIKREETWAVTTGLFRGTDNILLKAALEVCRHGDKAIPWAGTAVHRNPPATPAGQVTHKLACFLPLPLAEETLSATKPWTVWLHGWFDLNSSRREITRQADVGGTTQARYEWNRALMEHAVGPAWAMLVEQTCGLASDNDKPYALWPRIVNSQDTLDQALQKGFYQTAAAFPIIRGQDATGYRWCSLHDGVKDLPSRWHERLLLPLQAEGWTICNPSLPDFVEKGFRAADHCLPTITPATLRDDLQGDFNAPDLACTLAEAPRPMLTQREWIFALAEFCAEGDWSKLWYLPLALLADNRLHTFKLCGTVYWVEDHERLLLEPIPKRLLDIEFQKKLSQFKNLDCNSAGVVKLKLAGLIDSITEILELPKPLDKRRWLSAVFKYFKNCSAVEIKSNELRLKELKLVPDQRDQWHEMGLVTTPLLPMPGQKKELYEALMKLGISLLHNTKELSDAVHEFRHEHSGFIWNLTPSDVADYLNLHVEDSTTLNESALDDHEKILYVLLDFLASTDWLKKDDKRLPLLRKARILITVRGERVSADTKNLYLLGGFDPPAGVGAELRILYTKSNDSNWKRLFEALGVNPLSTDRFIEEVLLPSFANATLAERLVYLTWLRDQYQQIFRELPADKRDRLRQQIMETAIIPIKGGKLATPKTVYHPEAKEPVELLGDIARFPDIEFKKIRGSIESTWLDFFDEIKLPKRPLAQDLIKAIHALVEESKAKNVAAVRKPLRQIIVYLNECWHELKKQNYRLELSLSTLAWLPALSPKDRAEYAECGDWPDRLYKPSELIPSRLGHLAASVYPILDGTDFGYLATLGLRNRVELKEVLNHFEKVIKIPITTSNRHALWQAAIAAYRFFGDATEIWQIRAFSHKPSVYVNGVWQRPDRCFFNAPTKTRWTISLKNTGLGDESRAEQKGLEKMGVKPSPDQEYWLKVLHELSKEHGDHPLPEEPDRQEARLALRELRSCPDEWFSDKDIPVLLEDGRLKSARLAFIQDDPRLQQPGKCLAQLPLIEAGDSTDIAIRIGKDRSLKRALQDRLKERPQPTQNPDLIKLAAQIQERIRSKPFSISLHRILYDTDYKNRSSFPEVIQQVQSLNLSITESICVESFIVIEGQEVIAFRQDDAPSFLEKPSCCLWLLSKGKTKQDVEESIQDEITQNLCQEYDLIGQQILLMRLLDRPQDMMLDYLDKKGIAGLPDTAQKEFKYTDTQDSEDFVEEPPPPDEDQDQSTPDSPSDEAVDDEPSGAEAADDEPAATGPDLGSRAGPQAGPTEPRAKSTGEPSAKPKTKDQTAKEPHADRRDSPRSGPSPGPKPEEVTESPSTRPETASPKPPRDAMQFRLRSYVHHQTEDDYDDDDEESTSEAQEIGDAGEQFVMQQEQALGRTVQRMPKNHEGYDLESRSGSEIRYIEVKSTQGAWGLRGVKVTHPQYEAALAQGAAWWLYIVEHVNDPDKTVLHRLENPFHHITEFRFDDGWRNVAVAETAPTGPPAPKPGDRYQRGDGEIVTIQEAEPVGKYWRVTIQFTDHTTSTVMWDPQWRKL